MYANYIKGPLDVALGVLALLALSPLLAALTLAGAVAMRGNPFFVQERPGKDEKIFRLIKFRTMSGRRDENGRLLPDEERLTAYGRWLRSTSLDELGELFNIAAGQLAIVGPRPLLVKYLPLYSEEQRRRHDVKPGLTGLAQVNGRNALSWEDKFRYDLEYIRNITFRGDVKIILATISAVLRRRGVSSGSSVTMEEFTGSPAGSREE